jgi:hypothetical protein
VASYYSVPVTPDDIKRAIYQLGPVELGVNWPESWFRTPTSGILPRPDVSAGGHAIYAYGWSDDNDGGPILYLRNSWGAWGATMPDGRKTGNCLMPTTYLGRVFEAWRSWDRIER